MAYKFACQNLQYVYLADVSMHMLNKYYQNIYNKKGGVSRQNNPSRRKLWCKLLQAQQAKS